MTVPRRFQISLDHTPYYHCTTRCVRRAYLCGRDRHTGKDFSHRKQWLENRMAKLSQIFAIDLLAYAVMSNHYHVVVGLYSSKSKTWSDEEVKERWSKVFSVPEEASSEQLALWRERLCSLSWFMRCLNEPLARVSNREDGCKGRFWEGRFRCQALLDETALIRCMAYVDLNPIRAAVAKTPETSSHTSIAARIHQRDQHLAPFADDFLHDAHVIPMPREDYLQLIDWTGRQLQADKRGRIPTNVPPILVRLNLDSDRWLKEMNHYGKWYYRAVGSIEAIEKYCHHLGQNWLKGKIKLAEIAI
ncbi:MAG: transposase [Proteobacteria bacterium]|nr:transposase [Pseudomonadota bacterium]